MLCVSFEVMGFCGGFGGKLYSRRLTPCGRGLMAPPGLTALGAKGSACDRLRLTGGLRALALGSYIVSLRWRGTAPSAPFFIPPLAAKTIQPPCGRGNAIPLWWLAPPPFPRKRGHYKAPLCCERLMKGLLFRALLSHRSAGGRWCRKAPKGGKPPEVADRSNAFHNV